MCRQELPSWRFLFLSFLKNYKLFYNNNAVLLRKMTKRGYEAPKFLLVYKKEILWKK